MAAACLLITLRSELARRQVEHLLPQPAGQDNWMAAAHPVAGDDDGLAVAAGKGVQRLCDDFRLHLRLVGQGQQRARPLRRHGS